MTISSNSTSRLLLSAALGISLAGAAWCGPRAFAGPGAAHSHSNEPVSKDAILESSKSARDNLIAEGKIGTEWKSFAPDKADQKTMKSGKKEWLVTFKNPYANDKTKETLYMFFSLNGNYLAANFTGK